MKDFIVKMFYFVICRCLACPPQCDICENGGICFAKRDMVLKTTILGIQLTCMAVTVVLGLIVFKHRKCKVILRYQLNFSEKFMKYFTTTILYKCITYFNTRTVSFQTIASGMWTILETILLGLFLLYATVSPLNIKKIHIK